MQNEENEYLGGADDALSLLTGTLGGEGDFARGVTRESATAAMSEEYARRNAAPAPNTEQTPVATTETTRTEPPVATSPATTQAASAEHASDATVTTANATAGTSLTGDSAATDNTVHAASEAANSGTANGSTANGSTANGSTANGEATNSETAYDPNMPVVLSDGTRTTLGQLEHGAILKPRYDARVTELQKKERELEAAKKVVDGNLEYLNAVADDPFTIVYTTALKAGAPRDAALKAALEASPDMASLVLPKKGEDGPPQPGTERYYLTSYDKLGIDPGTPQYDEWYAGSVETRSKVAVREERALLRKDMEETLKTIKPTATPEEERDREVRKEFHESNTAVLNGSVPALALEIAKIDVNALSQGEREQFVSVMTKSFEAKKLMIDDRDWMEKNVLTETDVENAVLRAKDELQRLRSARSAASVQGAPTQGAPVQPQLIRPQLEKSVTTIAPLPVADAQVPVGPSYARDEAHQNVEDALNLLHA